MKTLRSKSVTSYVPPNIDDARTERTAAKPFDMAGEHRPPPHCHNPMFLIAVGSVLDLFFLQ
jgi:hypothetical protein